MQAYLTIDDSPTPYTNELLDDLSARGIPALFFVRGDMIETYGDEALRRAVAMGFSIGNHMVTHTRTSTMEFADVKQEIEIMYDKINDIYHSEGIKNPPLYFRFPHMDRGTGGHIIDYDAISITHRKMVIEMFAEGINIDLKPPTVAQIEHKHNIQNFLKSLGYAQPFHNINFPWFQGEMFEAVDCMYTYSTSDWMLLNRHKNSGKWRYKTIDDLKQKIDNDALLHNSSSNHIILAHDKDEAGFNKHVLLPLVDHLLEKECMFLPFDKGNV